MVGEVVSINVSEIKDVKWKGEIVRTGIFKDPTQGPVEIKGVNIIGDDQADRKAHGGLDKAIYSYAAEHYPYFRERFPDLKWQNGMFGENLTTTGIFEDETYVGDIFEIGSVQLIAVQ
ncbi:MAG: MOSC domain-containing protein, partial [Candidatus Kariarchaeaceae archaeon]